MTSSSSTSPLLFHFDFVSPYAFVGWAQVQAIAARTGRTLEPIPVLFAGLLDAHGTTGPAEIPAKRAYLFRDVFRKAHRLGLPPLRLPPAHPFNPLLALRVASVPLPGDDGAAKRRLIDALYAATWTDGTGIETTEAVVAAADRAGLDGEALVRAAQTPEIKQRLRAATEDAVARGVFGVPSVLADGELFWGTDGLDHLEAFLRGEDPVPKDHSWSDRPVSSKRRAAKAP